MERADRDDVPTAITPRGKQVAAVVSIDVLRKYQEWEEREINPSVAACASVTTASSTRSTTGS